MPRAKKALKTLPWVDQDSAKYDTVKREVRFKLKDKDKADEAALREAFKAQDFPEMTVKAMPK